MVSFDQVFLVSISDIILIIVGLHEGQVAIICDHGEGPVLFILILIGLRFILLVGKVTTLLLFHCGVIKLIAIGFLEKWFGILCYFRDNIRDSFDIFLNIVKVLLQSAGEGEGNETVIREGNND